MRYWLRVMVSFDVVSLTVTLIPVHRAIEIARDNLEKDESLDDRTSMTVNEICKLLEFRLNVTFLSYKGEYCDSTCEKGPIT